MPEPLDLEAIRGRFQKGKDAYLDDSVSLCQHYDMWHASALDVPALVAEVERLRAIAAPLERLETWRWVCDDRSVEIVAPDTASVYLFNDKANRESESTRDTLSEAITAALDAWEAAHGKDGP